MTYEQIINRIRTAVIRKELDLEDLADEVGLSLTRIRDILYLSEGTKLYTLLDILYEIGLEMHVNEKPMRDHQDVLVAYETILYDMELTPYTFCKRKNISHGSVKKFFDGEDVYTKVFFNITDKLGIEVRVV